MRNLLALLAVVVISFASVGWYRNWYNVQSSSNDVHITINKERVKDDVLKGEEKVHDALEKGQASEPARPAQTTAAEAPKPTPH